MVHKDRLDAPGAMFYKEGESMGMTLAFNGMLVTPENWPKTRNAAEEMLELWELYKKQL